MRNLIGDQFFFLTLNKFYVVLLIDIENDFCILYQCDIYRRNKLYFLTCNKPLVFHASCNLSMHAPFHFTSHAKCNLSLHASQIYRHGWTPQILFYHSQSFTSDYLCDVSKSIYFVHPLLVAMFMIGCRRINTI